MASITVEARILRNHLMEHLSREYDALVESQILLCIHSDLSRGFSTLPYVQCRFALTIEESNVMIGLGIPLCLSFMNADSMFTANWQRETYTDIHVG